MSAQDVTEEMPFEPIGLHEGCGGEVRLIWCRAGGFEMCMLCGGTGFQQDQTDLIQIEWEEQREDHQARNQNDQAVPIYCR
jgi:hypothetical protein